MWVLVPFFGLNGPNSPRCVLWSIQMAPRSGFRVQLQRTLLYLARQTPSTNRKTSWLNVYVLWFVRCQTKDILGPWFCTANSNWFWAFPPIEMWWKCDEIWRVQRPVLVHMLVDVRAKPHYGFHCDLTSCDKSDASYVFTRFMGHVHFITPQWQTRPSSLGSLNTWRCPQLGRLNE